MGTINTDSPFIHYDLSPEELRQGQVLGDLNKQVLQNMLFQVVMEKLNLPILAENTQREAELAGQMRMLQSILDNHNLAIQTPIEQHEPEPQDVNLHGIFPHTRRYAGDISFPDA